MDKSSYQTNADQEHAETQHDHIEQTDGVETRVIPFET